MEEHTSQEEAPFKEKWAGPEGSCYTEIDKCCQLRSQRRDKYLLDEWVLPPLKTSLWRHSKQTNEKQSTSYLT